MTTARRLLAIAAGLLAVAACTGTSEGAGGPTTVAPSASTSTSTTVVPVDTGSLELGPPDRPARLVAPEEVDAPAPLVVVLHGYTSTSAQQDAYLGVSEQAASRGLYVLLPDGTTSDSGERFWDATPACCNFTGTPVDDVGYLRDLIADAIDQRPIDPDRVYLFGHSNGGFMAYRMACELSDQVTAIAVLAGSDLPDEDGCVPDHAVSVLHLHGDADRVIQYEGGRTVEPYPGAVEVVARWATRAGCDAAPVDGEPIDLDGGLDGPETAVQAYEGCEDGVDVQLDTIEGGEHVPGLVHESVGVNVLDWLLDHSR